MANISQIKLPNGDTYDIKDSSAAPSNHTHSTSIATSTDTNQVTLAFGSKYMYLQCHRYQYMMEQWYDRKGV